ncbi:hypothetical protein Tco_0422026 [Tanacetum coccineum]
MHNNIMHWFKRASRCLDQERIFLIVEAAENILPVAAHEENELTRTNLQVSPMQVNVQFLQQLQPEWSRFVTVVKQSQEIDTVSYHKLFDVLKQFQNEVNDIRSERLARKIAKPVTPQSESVSEEDSDPEQARRDKDMKKNLALLAKYFKKLYKPTNNNLRDFSNSHEQD